MNKYPLSYIYEVENNNTKQKMAIFVDYYKETNEVDNIEVYIMENNKPSLEISLLLDNVKGNPLAHIINSIDWGEVYYDTIELNNLPLEN